MYECVDCEHMEFITIKEHNEKENEVFIYFCQWTGNEEELLKLSDVMGKSSFDYRAGSDASWFQMSLGTISESAVDEIVNKVTGFNMFNKMFHKCTGVFTCPEFDDTDIERQLDELFYACQLPSYFLKNGF